MILLYIKLATYIASIDMLIRKIYYYIYTKYNIYNQV